MVKEDEMCAETISQERSNALMNTPSAHHVHVFTCGDPECGPHIVLFDKDDCPIMQAVLKLEYVQEFCEILQSVGPYKRRKQLS